MTNIVCNQDVLAIIKEQSLAGLPNEICGLLFGQGWHITRAIPIVNIAPEPHTSFLMEGHQVTSVLRQQYKQGYEWIAVYHSHPKGGTTLSHTDRDFAFPGVLQMVYSVPTQSVHLFEVYADHIKERNFVI